MSKKRNEFVMNRLKTIESTIDIPLEYQNTPIGLLFEYHNLNRSQTAYPTAQLMVGMCMDNRKNLRIPDNFAYVLRAGGGNLRSSGFKVSYAIAVGGVRYVALIGHTQCGMINLIARKEQFIQGLIDGAGWKREQAQKYFTHFAPKFEIGDEVDFVLSETIRLRRKYPKIIIVPLIYRVEDNLLYLVNEETSEIGSI
jgi:carbonic anhydrase